MARSKSLIEAQKRYREKNYAKVKQINAKSNKKRYHENDENKEKKSQYYYMNRNYRGIDNVGSQLKLLFQEV